VSLAANGPDSGTLVRRSVVLGERGSERQGAGSSAGGSADSTGGASAGTANEDWVEIRSGLAPGARVLRGSIGTVPSGTPARLGAPSGSGRSLAAMPGPAPAAAATATAR
jgi:hypothetical protein